MSPSKTNPGLQRNSITLNPPAVTLLNKRQWAFLQRRYQMTPRELQIAKLICRGLGYKDIARSCDIKAGTVKSHTRNIYRKTWVHNKISMLLRFVEDSRPFADRPAAIGLGR
jgi:DNA-binding NarL/FixJ family response regulator